MILGQITGAEDAVKAAASRGYEAVLLVVIVIAMLVAFGFAARWLLASTQKREDRLSMRIDVLENFIHTTLIGIIEKNQQAIDSHMRATMELTRAISARPCLMDVDKGKQG